MDIDGLLKRYLDSCQTLGHIPNSFIQCAFNKAQLSKEFNGICVLELNVDQITEDDYAPLNEVLCLVNTSDVDVVDIIHTSHSVVQNGHDFLALLRCIGPKLRKLDLKDISLGKIALRDLLETGLSCQIMNLSSCYIKRLNMIGRFSTLHTLMLDFNTYITSLPEGCFKSMPKLRRMSMCETRISNLWTTIAALSKLPMLTELRFQNCLCCMDTGKCPLSSTEKLDCFPDKNLNKDDAANVWPVTWSALEHCRMESSDAEEGTVDSVDSDEELATRHGVVHSLSEDSSSDESDQELHFRSHRRVPLQGHLASLQQQTDFLRSLRSEEAETIGLNYNSTNISVPSSSEIEIGGASHDGEGFSGEAEVMLTSDRELLKDFDFIACEGVVNGATLDDFYDSVSRPATLNMRVTNGEGAFEDGCSNGSVPLAGFSLRQNASHHPSPICFEKYYREFMIASLAHLEVLDNLPVTQIQKDRAKVVFTQHFELLPYNRRVKENMVDVLKAREIGSNSAVHPCKRRRLGMVYGDSISFTRSMSAAKMGTCAWPATHPISRLRRNGSDSSKKFKPRQFEYHPLDSSLMVFGTLDGEVVVINHESGKIVGHVQSVGSNHSILGLCWLNKDPTKLIAGSDNGTLQLYDVNQMRSTVRLGRSGAVNSNSNPASYTYEEFEQLTSVHVNATDDYFLASGYSNHVSLYDVQSGKKLQVFQDLHSEHINVVKFAHHSPNVFATSSFDKGIKMWDLRQKPLHPLYTTTSSRGNVMVCFSRDDNYLLSSAVDNEVKQHLAVDGRLHMKFDITPTGSSQNYTRSYYMNGRDYVISGSCEENIVRICCAKTGRRLKDLSLEGRGTRSSLYVQSLRGDPFRDFHLSVLAAYLHPDSKSEILKINLLSSDSYVRDKNFDLQYLPFSGMGG